VNLPEHGKWKQRVLLDFFGGDEKANVCTSVRNKYFTVESASPKREFAVGKAVVP
jgi:hypothetical protein